MKNKKLILVKLTDRVSKLTKTIVFDHKEEYASEIINEYLSFWENSNLEYCHSIFKIETRIVSAKSMADKLRYGLAVTFEYFTKRETGERYYEGNPIGWLI